LTVQRTRKTPPAWTVADAKARLSELIERAQAEPQTITRDGKSSGVVVSVEEWGAQGGAERQPRRIPACLAPASVSSRRATSLASSPFVLDTNMLRRPGPRPIAEFSIGSIGSTRIAPLSD
jgi:prevent-host-death family protein